MVVILLGWLFVPIYIKAGVRTTFCVIRGELPFYQAISSAILTCNHVYWMCLGRDHARVLEEEVRRAAHPHLSLSALTLPLCLH